MMPLPGDANDFPVVSESCLARPATMPSAGVGPALVKVPAPDPGIRWGGTGWLPDPHDPRDHPVRARFGAGVALPRSATRLVDRVRRVKNQGRTGSCVAHAALTAVDTRLCLVATGRGLPMPQEGSERAVYAGALAMDRVLPSPDTRPAPLQDRGCFPRQLMRWMRERGIPPLDLWPFSEGGITDEVPMDVLEAASAARLDRWWRSDGSGVSFELDAAVALAEDHPFIFGTTGVDAFQQYTGGVIDLLVPSEQGHDLCLLGYETGADGERVFLGVNSWGEEWGEGGFFRLAASELRGPTVSDGYVIEAVAS